MKKSALRLLGRLLAMEEELWNQLAENPHSQELRNKYRLVRKIKKGLEEKSRGFLKTKVPYTQMAETILEFAKEENYEDLHKRVIAAALRLYK